MPAAVETFELKKRYEARKRGGSATDALRGLSLRIEVGEIFALLGPNGAGKTTWISTVCGLTRPTSGRAEVLGHDVVGAAMQARRAIGLVPQELGFDPFFTSRESLRFQMGYYGVPPDEARVREVLAAMGLSDKADASSRELSGGMKRRLLIAKALVHKPKVVFLDEPTAGVDVILRRELWAYVRRLREGGTTIVLTTHYLEEVEALADRVAVIDHGALVRLEKPSRLVEEHGRKRIKVVLAAPRSGALPTALITLGATLDAARTTVECALPEADIGALLGTLAALGPIADVSVEQPTLEQVFLELTRDRTAPPPRSPPPGSSGSSGSSATNSPTENQSAPAKVGA